MNTTQKILQEGIKGDARTSDKNKMLAMFHDDEKEIDLKAALFQQLINASSDRGTLEIADLFEKFWTKTLKKERRKTKILKLGTSIAALIVLGMFSGFLINSWLPDKTNYVAKTPKGSISQVVLPDSTIIYLNSGSEIKYTAATDAGNREVFLEGEAWFQVSKNKNRPFIVHTSLYDVNVLGTEFNVKAYSKDDKVTTTLENGVVRITSSKLSMPTKDIILKPSEQITFSKSEKTIEIRKVNPKWINSWKDNKLIFINLNLKEIIILLERKYGVDIEVRDKEILNFHYDGTIKNESILEVLKMLEETLPIQHKIIEQRIVITKKPN